MSRIKSKHEKRQHRHKRVRAKVKGTAAIPRLSVFRSNRHLWVQLIDDAVGKTMASASSGDSTKKKKGASGVGRAEEVGRALAKRALEKKIGSAVFDRGGYKYHGLVKAIADGVRKGGLKL